jgi:hypothetical protein
MMKRRQSKKARFERAVRAWIRDHEKNFLMVYDDELELFKSLWWRYN